MIRMALVAALLTAPHMATGQEDAAPLRSEAPAPRPDPETRATEFEADMPGGDADVEAAEAEGAETALEAAPLWQTLQESPEDYAACLAELDALGTLYEERAAVTGDLRDCGIANPLEVTEIVPGVSLRPEALMRCETALATARWVSGTVTPAAKRTGKLAPLSAINHGSTYVCRARGGVASGKLSEHALGNAIDVMGFRFEDDTSLAIEPRADAGTIEEAFQRATRGGACLDFTTVLGPGTDAAHADHLHLDVKARNGGYRICQ